MKKTTDLSKSFEKLKEVVNWEETETILRSNHFTPTKVYGKGNKVIGLTVLCPPILEETRKERLREVLGEGFEVCYQEPDSLLIHTKR